MSLKERLLCTTPMENAPCHVKYIGLFHFISIQGDGCRIPGVPWKNRTPWGMSVKSGFTRLIGFK